MIFSGPLRHRSKAAHGRPIRFFLDMTNCKWKKLDTQWNSYDFRLPIVWRDGHPKKFEEASIDNISCEDEMFNEYAKIPFQRVWMKDDNALSASGPSQKRKAAAGKTTKASASKKPKTVQPVVSEDDEEMEDD